MHATNYIFKMKAGNDGARASLRARHLVETAN